LLIDYLLSKLHPSWRVFTVLEYHYCIDMCKFKSSQKMKAEHGVSRLIPRKHAVTLVFLRVYSSHLHNPTL